MQDIAPSLPEGVQGPAVDDEFDDTFGTIYAFIPEGFTLREVRDSAETIRRELMSLPDMGKTTLLGEQQEQWVLAFSPARLAGMGLDIQDVADALRAQNAVVPAGTMRTGQENMAIKVSGALTTEESLRAVTLHVNNRYIPLTDIATVTREIAEPPAPAYRVNGKPAIGLAVSMAPTGNMLRFGAALNAKMAALSAGLPHGIEMVKVADQSAVVSEAVSGFIRVLIEAVVIVLAVSFVSLGLRAGLVVATAIPLVLAMTFVGMMLAGIGLQRISLGALIIALGLLVDDAMIAVETMVSRLEAGDSRRLAATYAFKTTAFPMLTGTLVMIAGFIPVGFAASSAGEYCFSLFAVVLIALLCSPGRRDPVFAANGHVAAAGKSQTSRGRTGKDRARVWTAFTPGAPPPSRYRTDCACRAGAVSVRHDVYAGRVFPRLGPARVAGQPDASGQRVAAGNAQRGGKAGKSAGRQQQYRSLFDVRWLRRHPFLPADGRAAGK